MKGKPAKAGIGSGLQNTKTIKTERPSNKKIGGGGLPSTYHGNARAIDTERGCK